MRYLRKAVRFLSSDHNRRVVLWKVRRVMLVVAAVVETILRDTVDDLLPAAT